MYCPLTDLDNSKNNLLKASNIIFVCLGISAIHSQINKKGAFLAIAPQNLINSYTSDGLTATTLVTVRT
jgi:hypothetical protein